jgi:hypothetical protein
VLSLVEERLFRPKCTGRRLERLRMIYAEALYTRPTSPSGLAEDYVESLHRRIVAIRQCFAHYDPATVARNVPWVFEYCQLGQKIKTKEMRQPLGLGEEWLTKWRQSITRPDFSKIPRPTSIQTVWIRVKLLFPTLLGPGEIRFSKIAPLCQLAGSRECTSLRRSPCVSFCLRTSSGISRTSLSFLELAAS